jgi:RHS repeat-associated protein
VLISQTGTTPNVYRYAGEQWDEDLGLYYNRARYLDVNRGRFWTQDTFEGDIEDPLSLHKYLYGNGNPIGNVDPSGNVTVGEVLNVAGYISTLVAAIQFAQNPSIDTASALALELAIPGLGKGITALRDSERVFAVLQKAKFVKGTNEINSFKTLSDFGYKLVVSERALKLINDGLGQSRKLVEGIFSTVNGKLSLVEAKKTLNSTSIKETINKITDVVETLEKVIGVSESVSSIVEEIILVYSNVVELKEMYELSQSKKLLEGGIEVQEIFKGGKAVTVEIRGKSIPVYAKQVPAELGK